jgi:hypothetical protein
MMLGQKAKSKDVFALANAPGLEIEAKSSVGDGEGNKVEEVYE